MVFAISFEAEAKSKIVKDDSKLMIKLMEEYLLDMDTLVSPFKQVDAQGVVRKGKMFVSKPNKVRIEYYTPEEDLIVVNDQLLMYYNFPLEEKNYAQPDQLFLDFIVSKKFVLTKNARVLKFSSYPGYADLMFQIKNDKQERIITMSFDKEPLRLQQISVSSNGEMVSLALSNVRLNSVLDDYLFNLDNLRLSR